MKYKLVVLVLLFLCGCSNIGQTAVTSTPTIHILPSTPTLTPSPTAESQMCAFVWANQDLPEISREVQSAIQKIQPKAQASAQAYGENCIYEDGHSTFSAMETDFYVTFQVKNQNNPEELGGLIVQTMKALEQFPRSKISGGQDGFVEFRFESGDKNNILRVSITKYKELPAGLKNAAIYRAFENPSP